jgi:hypothetical protein
MPDAAKSCARLWHKRVAERSFVRQSLCLCKRGVCAKYMLELEDADVMVLAIHQSEQDGLFAKMRRGFGGEGISEK